MGPCLRRGTSYLSEAGVQRLARVEQFLDRVDRDLEARLVGTVEFDLDDLLDPARADLHRHANIEAIDAVLAVDKRGAGQDALLVTEVRFGHRDAPSRGRLENGRASCRDRVCQYVLISVGAVSLKKKT